jgi:hypothetical protein
MFKQNVGRMDRVLRIALGIAMAVIGLFVLKGTTGTVLGIIGLIPLPPGWSAFARSTCRSSSARTSNYDTIGDTLNTRRSS